MAIKVTPDIIREINERYYKCHNKSQVAREVGCSAGTVSKYIDPNYTPFDSSKEIHFTLEMLPPADYSRFVGLDNFGAVCTMSAEEKYEIEELWKEIH